MIKIPATPTKLKNGSWGARVATTNVRAGDIVIIKTRDGKTWEEEVTKVVWSGNGVSICATSNTGRRAPRKSATPTGCSCGSVVEYSKPTDCWTCRHDA